MRLVEDLAAPSLRRRRTRHQRSLSIRRAQEATMNQVRLPQGTIDYRESGSGETILLVHGLLTDGELWRDVAPRLAADFRVIAPDWPLGSQARPLAADSDFSPPALAALIATFMDELGLERVTLVGNDTGGALCQIVAVEHPERLARLVLTPCDAYEHFPPPAFKPMQEIARLPGGVFTIMQSMRSARARRLPNAYGGIMKRADDELTASWVASALRDGEIRRQVGEILKGFSKSHTLAAAARFNEFDKPVLVAWAPDDRFFTLADAERLVADFPNARLELIEDSYTLVSLDQPQRTAELIAAFAREPLREHDRSLPA
jgi:pimeloyl-ACP methyl ester carboxylesterase